MAQSNSQLSNQGSYITLTKTGNTNAQGNPLYLISLYANGQRAAAFESVTGRSHTQDNNRHVAGTEAPLPNGRYTVASSTVPGTHPEVGDRFLPIYPQFQTGRSALGIHYDPSFDMSNGKDGTSGCIALTNRQDLDHVLSFIRTYQPQYLEVNI
ncbi:MAG: L,D-transpeptidase [Cyanophyceae cyanobacterium]